MKYVLDTDHISILERKSGAEFATLFARISAVDSSEFAYSIISFHEQSIGCHGYINSATEPSGIVRGYAMLEGVLEIFSSSRTLPFDSVAASIFVKLRAMRLRVATMDLRIASIALSRDLILLTRNVADFGKIPGLQIEDWTR